LFFAATRKRPPAAGASAGSGGPGLSSEEFKMSDKETTRIAPTLKVALLSGAMGIALVGCGQALDGDPVALPPVADMVTADGPDVAGAPAPIAPGHPDRGTVGGGPGTGAWQSDDQTIATGESAPSPTMSRLIPRTTPQWRQKVSPPWERMAR